MKRCGGAVTSPYCACTIGGRRTRYASTISRVLARADQRLVGEREDRRFRLAEVLDARSERASHAGQVGGVDGVPHAQPLEGGQDPLVLVPDDDEHVVEARGADLLHRSADERLPAERQEELVRPHSRRRAGREDNGADDSHANSLRECRAAECV